MALTDSLVACWQLNESSGNALDSVGSNTLTENGTVSPATPPASLAGARAFESASSEFFEIADNADLSTGDIDFTVACWVKLATLAGIDIVSKFGTGQRSYVLTYSTLSNAFQFVVSSNGTNTTTRNASTAGAASAGTWYFVVGWHDSVNNLIGIAVNAGTADTTAYSSGTFDGTSSFRLAARSDGTRFMNGTLSQVGVWKRVLSSGERTSLYNGGSGLAYPFASTPAGADALHHYRTHVTGGAA